MADFNTGEYHQGLDEYFPTNFTSRKKSIGFSAAKLLAAAATAAIAVTMMLSSYVDCFATQITTSSATLNISVMNWRPETSVNWQLMDEVGDTVTSGIIDTEKDQLELTGLRAGTKYEIVFTAKNEDGQNEEKGRYSFTTGTEKYPVISPQPSAVPPTEDKPMVKPSPAVSPSVSPSASPSASPSPSPSASPTATPEPTSAPAPQPTRAPAVSASPSPEVSESPTPTPEVSESPSPSPSPEVSESPSPSPTPEATPPDAEADAPSAPYVTSAPDGAIIGLEFPFAMNSNDQFTNTATTVEIAYEISSADGNIIHSGTYEQIEDDGQGTVKGIFETSYVGASVPLNGGLTATATLTYQSENIDSGEMITDRTATSDTITLSTIYLDEATDAEVSEIAVDTDSQNISGSATFVVNTGPYGLSTVDDELVLGNLTVTVFDTAGAIMGEWIENLGSQSSTGENITTQFVIDTFGFDLALGETYTAQIRLNGSWHINGIPVSDSRSYGSFEFTYGVAPEPTYLRPTAVDTVFFSYQRANPSVTDGSGNDSIGADFSFSLNDALPESISIVIEEILNYLDGGSVTKEAVTYSGTDITTDGGNISVTHNATSSYYNGYWQMGYIDSTEVLVNATLHYTLPDNTQGTVSGQQFKLSPFVYFYDENNVTNTMEASVTTQDTADVRLVTYSATLSDIHVGTGSIEFDSGVVYYWLPTGGYVEYPLRAENVTVNSSTGVTKVSGSLEIPLSDFTENELLLCLDVTSNWIETVKGVPVTMSQSTGWVETTIYLNGN